MVQDPSSPKPLFAPRYLLATLLLLITVIGIYTVWDARRLRKDLARELEERGLALLDVLEASAKNAITGNRLLEDLIGQRLLDNARLIDRLIGTGGYDDGVLQQVAQENRLLRVELLDQEGNPYRPRPSSRPTLMMPHRRMGMMRMHHGEHWEPGGPPWEGEPEDTEAHQHKPRMGMGTPFMWGHRWHGPEPAEKRQILPKALQERRFWEGSDFGVAIDARSFPGLIVVHADARFLLNFRKEIGLQPLMEDLAKRPGVAFVSLQDPSATILAHSDPTKVGQVEKDPFFKASLEKEEGGTRLIALPDGRKAFEVARPFGLGRSRLGLLRLGLLVDPIEKVWHQDRQTMLFLTGGILLIGTLGTLGIFLNQRRYLSQVKVLEEEVQRGKRLSALGNLAAGVAHEIRNPLNAISMGLQRLKREFTPSGEEGEYRRFLEIMQAEVKRLDGIVTRFLQLARPIPLKLEEVDLRALLESLLLLVHEEAENRGITLKADLPSTPFPIFLDPGQIKQVLLNLLSNAFQATPEGGTVTVWARRVRRSTFDGRPFEKTLEGEAIEIGIADTGVGIPPEHLERIFEPYFTTREGGTGLGLAIAHRIVDAHRGRIEVESEVGKGTTFHVLLPLKPGGNRG